MSYKVLSKREAQIIAAMASGVIPRGGKSFDLGAADLEDKWLFRTDHMLSRMPIMTRLSLRMIIHVLNYAWPLLYMKEFKPLTDMDEQERTELFHIIEQATFPGPLTILVVKVLVFPAFYGLSEVKHAIDYQEKFPNSPDYVGPKD
jgi:hypothetical protein